LALIEAGIARLVIAMQDPNPLVSGRGISMLRNAGIEVQVGLLEDAARALNPGFLCKMERQRPFVRPFGRRIPDAARGRKVRN
jgi:diaminohydroxyphosphoribosylaminopyrimidine deaminase/5-amino-6-(5-phosphoribosylamino)uracil reductase